MTNTKTIVRTGRRKRGKEKKTHSETKQNKFRYLHGFCEGNDATGTFMFVTHTYNHITILKKDNMQVAKTIQPFLSLSFSLSLHTHIHTHIYIAPSTLTNVYIQKKLNGTRFNNNQR
mmetsp:Transcript_20061/g.29010  ORF Transcript_20061/g.29010 Transcript_20061/m.29010 type:complete len:117 (+) Transcript_20061:722-1072(+)